MYSYWKLTSALAILLRDVAHIVKAERVVLVAEVELQVVVAVVVVDGHAHLQHLRLVLLQVGLDIDGVVAWHHVHALHALLVRLVPGKVFL